MHNKEKILHAAMLEFTTSGYNQTSVNKLIEITQLSKGTFYHYFKSKEAILDAIIDHWTDQILLHTRTIIQHHSTSNAIELLTYVLIGLNVPQEKPAADTLIHAPENVLLHQKFASALIQRITPEICTIIEKGIQEHLFSVQLPHVMIEILLLSQYLFDENMFKWSNEQKREKIMGIIIALERLLGTKEGSFIHYQNYLLKHLLQGEINE